MSASRPARSRGRADCACEPTRPMPVAASLGTAGWVRTDRGGPPRSRRARPRSRQHSCSRLAQAAAYSGNVRHRINGAGRQAGGPVRDCRVDVWARTPSSRTRAGLRGRDAIRWPAAAPAGSWPARRSTPIPGGWRVKRHSERTRRGQGLVQTDTCSVLSTVKGSRDQSDHRPAGSKPAICAMRSSSAGQT